MKKTLVALFFVVSSAYFTICNAQYVRPGENNSSTPPPEGSLPPGAQTPGFADRLSVGGSFGLQFGTYTYVALEPLLDYHVSNSFIVGVGPVYQYLNVSEQVFGYGYTSSIYGARAVAMFFLPDEFSKVFIMGECDVLNVPEPGYNTYQIERGYLTIPMLGLGYKQPISDKVFFCIYALWNFNNSPYNPYTNPNFNFGVDIGLWH